VETVTHDAVLGDLCIRSEPVNDCLAEACALTVMGGRSTNVYLPCNSEMIVGLRPAEAARALYLRWQRTGVPPVLPNGMAWFFLDDGFAAYGWRPVSIPFERWCAIDEPVDVRVRRQRKAAGLL
jgi:hypothetical protein